MEKVINAVDLAMDDILSVMMDDPEAYRIARYELGLYPGMFTSESHKQVYQAMSALYESGKPIHDTLILERCGSQVTLQFISTLIGLNDLTRQQAVFVENVEMVKQHGLRVGTYNILQTASAQLKEGKSRDEVVRNLLAVLPTIGRSGMLRHVEASVHGPENIARRLSGASIGYQIGINWLDQCTAGWEDGHIWWIAGAYKARKTSLMLNLALAAALNGMRPAIYSLEMTQRQIQDTLTAMIAVAWLIRHGHYNATVKTSNGHQVGLNWISGSWLRKVGDGYRQGDMRRAAAIDYANTIYQTLPLRIYDSTPQNGNLSSLESVESMIWHDKRAFGGNIHFVDYLQLITGEGSLYERTSRAANRLQNAAKSQETTLCVLAQRNEEGIAGGDSYSPRIKGGGDPAQTADYLLLTRYHEGEGVGDNELQVSMHLSRHGATGKEVFEIHPDSGLILGQSWLSMIEGRL